MEKGLIVHTLIYDEHGKVLIIKRSKDEKVLANYWDLPGGTLEDGEDPEKGALREIAEEIGLKIKRAELFYFHSNVDKAKNKQFITLIFIAKHNKGRIKLNSEDHSEFAWINPKTDSQSYKTVPYLKDCLGLLRKETYLEAFGKTRD